MNLVIKYLEQTCSACPSQWEGTFTDGSEAYIRYRHGWLSVDKDDESVFEARIGGNFDGYIELDEVLKITGITLEDNDTIPWRSPCDTRSLWPPVVHV